MELYNLNETERALIFEICQSGANSKDISSIIRDIFARHDVSIIGNESDENVEGSDGEFEDIATGQEETPTPSTNASIDLDYYNFRVWDIRDCANINCIQTDIDAYQYRQCISWRAEYTNQFIQNQLIAVLTNDTNNYERQGPFPIKTESEPDHSDNWEVHKHQIVNIDQERMKLPKVRLQRKVMPAKGSLVEYWLTVADAPGFLLKGIMPSQRRFGYHAIEDGYLPEQFTEDQLLTLLNSPRATTYFLGRAGIILFGHYCEIRDELGNPHGWGTLKHTKGGSPKGICGKKRVDVDGVQFRCNTCTHLNGDSFLANTNLSNANYLKIMWWFSKAQGGLYKKFKSVYGDAVDRVTFYRIINGLRRTCQGFMERKFKHVK